MPVFTEYADWKAGRPEARQAVPGLPHAEGRGRADRDGLAGAQGVPHHGLLGKAKRSAHDALALEVDASTARGHRVTVDADEHARGPRGAGGLAGAPDRRARALRRCDWRGAVARRARARPHARRRGRRAEAPFWQRDEGRERHADPAGWRADVAFTAMTRHASRSTSCIAAVGRGREAARRHRRRGATDDEATMKLGGEGVRRRDGRRNEATHDRLLCGCCCSSSSCSARRSARSPSCSIARRASASPRSSTRSREVTLDLARATAQSLYRQECRVVAEEPRLRAVVATEDVARDDDPRRGAHARRDAAAPACS